MAHKALRGRKAPSAPGVKKSVKKKKAAKKSGKAQAKAGAKGGSAKAAAERAFKNQKAKKAAKSKEAQAEAAEKRTAEVEAVVAAEAAEAAAKRAKLPKKEARELFKVERTHKALYTAGDKILLVGEGNFSFARALAKELQSANGLCATSFDGEAVLNKKYPDAAGCRKELEGLGGVSLVGVDATQLHRIKEFRGKFNKVVWNFPHIGSGESNVEKSIEEHRKLLASFLACVPKCLEKGKKAQIHISLKAGEPYKSWKLVPLARAAAPDFELRTAVLFATSAWPGYAHRRTQGFDEKFSKADNEELATGSKVYIFERDAMGED